MYAVMSLSWYVEQWVNDIVLAEVSGVKVAVAREPNMPKTLTDVIVEMSNWDGNVTMILQLASNGTGELKLICMLLSSWTMPATEEDVLESTTKLVEVRAPAVETVTEAVPSSIVPRLESRVEIVNPLTVAVDIGFLNPEMLNEAVVPPDMEELKALLTLTVLDENEH